MTDFLGKIKDITIGRGGYQDVMFGVSVVLGGESWGTSDFKGTWGTCMADGKDAEWKSGQKKVFAEAMLWLDKLCDEAKVRDVKSLIGKPIRATFSGPNGRLLSWEILKEVL